MNKAILQVALDLLDLKRAVQIAEESVDGGADWIEAGTPLIKSEGMQAVRSLRDRFPQATIVADMKVADTGAIEVEMAAKAGADIVCILADADDAVVADAVRAARLYGIRLMADLINSADPPNRAAQLESMGIDIICAHVGIDQQMTGKDSLDLLATLAGTVRIPVAVAGGIDAEGAQEAVRRGAGIVIVGGWIVRSADVTGSTRKIREAMDKPSGTLRTKKSGDEETRAIFLKVSGPNVTDAMHRKGAMAGLFSVCGNVKMAGRAVTVHTIAGDWAKPVEAIDLAQKGDVLVINNDGVTDVAPWGELATLTVRQRGSPALLSTGLSAMWTTSGPCSSPCLQRRSYPMPANPRGSGRSMPRSGVPGSMSARGTGSSATRAGWWLSRRNGPTRSRGGRLKCGRTRSGSARRSGGAAPFPWSRNW
jgi:3-hexulose-6-phosphate synthase/6-phospho-3-hexuloisomerase